MITLLTVFVFTSVQEAIKTMEFLDYEGLKQYHTNLQATMDTALQSKADVTKVVSHTESAVTIQPNVMNVWGEVTDLTITKGKNAETESIVNNYMIRFTVAEEGTPDIQFDWDEEEIQWYGGNEIEFVNGNTYEISIVNNIALWAEFEPKAE